MINSDVLKTNNVFSVQTNIKIQFEAGRFLIKTITTQEELLQAFALRYQVFQVEMIGHENNFGLDHDEFDEVSDHLAIFDKKTNQMVATCRLNCSLFSNKFYSEQEFDCSHLLKLQGTKLEIGRVCVRHDFRKGIIIMLLWRSIADYMIQSQTKILFGCGSVSTLDASEALNIYRYLIEENKVNTKLNIFPTEKFKSAELEALLLGPVQKLSLEQRKSAETSLPSLCKSYFDIGCYVPGPPAFDHEFKCIDFLTILEVEDLNPRIRQKMLGNK